MKDIDFDELDKAVSSLLGEAEKEPTHEESSSISADVDTSNENIDTKEPIDTVGSQAAASTDAGSTDVDSSSIASQANLVEKRSKGRFMDVVHPSSDMRNLQKPSVPRTAPDVLPAESDTEDENSDDNMITPNPGEGEFDFGVTTAPQTNESLDETTTTGGNDDDKHNQPDPLDFHGFSNDETKPDEKEDAGAPLDAHDSESTTESTTPEGADELDHMASELAGLDSLLSSSEHEAPLETPFVSTTDSLEKRPLGAFSSSQADDPESSKLDEEQNSELPEGDSLEANLNDEEAHGLDQSDDPQSIEKSEEPIMSSTVDTELDNAPSAPAVEPTVLNQPTDEAELQTVPEPDTTPEELREELVSIEAAEVTTANPVGALSASGSIPQQYTTKPVSPHTEPTAVFDTDQYHQPLKHAPKKKSGVGIVILIIALIIAGAGGGAAFYFFDPFHLFS